VISLSVRQTTEKSTLRFSPSVSEATSVVLVYLLNNHYLSFWERRGFNQLESSTFLVGNAGPVFTIKACMGDFFKGIYDKYKQHKVIGLYMSYDPVLVINDPKLVQEIMIRDFKSFHDRPMPQNEDHDPITGNLFNLPGQKWRDMRVKLSPTFTSGKLKSMFPIIRDCSKVLEDFLVKSMKNDVDVFEFRDLMARFNTNIISSVAFGVENDCINEPEHRQDVVKSSQCSDDVPVVGQHQHGELFEDLG
jgi:cytochrome P450 family 6